MKPLKLFYHGPNKGKTNFGDALSPLIVQALTGRDVVYSSVLSCDMIAVGSILDTFYRWLPLRQLLGRSAAGRLPVAVWGSGFIRDGGPRDPAPLRLLALRGPRTRARLCPGSDVPLGDPGLLVRELDRPKRAPRYAWGLVPHMADIRDPRVTELVESSPHATLIRLDADPIETLDRIAACDRIASSSLHGLIVADALGIPNMWVEFGDRLKGGRWKFGDYFASVGRGEAVPTTFRQGAQLDALGGELPTAHFKAVPGLCDQLKRALSAL